MLRNSLISVFVALFIAGCGGSGSGSGSEDGGGGAGNGTTTSLLEITNSPAFAVAEVPYHYQPELKTSATPLQFRAKNLPDWASLDAATGEITGTPAADDVTAYSPFTLAVKPGANSSTQEQVLQVLPTDAYLGDAKVIAFDSLDYEGNKRTLRKFHGSYSVLQGRHVRWLGQFAIL